MIQRLLQLVKDWRVIRLTEEVLRYVFESARERELVYVFRTCFDGPIRPSAELDGGRFWTLDEIRAARGSGVLTPNFESEFTQRIEPLLH